MVLDGQNVQPGDVLSPALVEALKTKNASRYSSLMRVGYLMEVSDSLLAPKVAEPEIQVEVADQVADEGDMCPTCEKGPFQRLNSHMTKAHS